MLGAIIGDIVGSRFEFDNIKTTKFDMFAPDCRFTDDTVMTLAIAKAIVDADGDWERLGGLAVKYMRELGRRYCPGDYGANFSEWLHSDSIGPYNSYGNGAAMRVSPCGFAARTLDEAKLLARKVTEVTHNHPEGIKGAEAVASCIYMNREGKSKDEIRAYVDKHYYPMDFTLDGIRADYEFNETCQDTVPQAITAFLESEGLRSAVRLAVSIGGDSDTLAAIAGSIAGARYGIPDWERRSAEYYLDERLLSILGEFEDKYADEVVSTEMGSVPRISLDIGDGDFALTDVKFIRYDLGYKKIHRKYVIEANLEHKEERCDVYGSGVHDFREAVPGLASAMKHIRVPAFLPLRRDRHTVRKVCDALYSAMDMLGLHNANEDANNRAGGQG